MNASVERDLNVLLNGVQDLLWEKLHAIAGASGRDRNAEFRELFLELCCIIGPRASFEVGAREALYSRELTKRLPKTKCYAFEANPYVFERFRTLMPAGLNYVNEAIGCDGSPKQFYIPRTIPRRNGNLKLTKINPTSSLKLRRGAGIEYETVTCNCNTLDVWHERLGWPTSAVWIDAEGATEEVIRGASRALRSSIACVFVEMEKSAGWKDQWLAGDVIAAMESFGFRPLARDCETVWQYNQIFICGRAMSASVVKSVGKYIDRLLGGSPPHPD